MNLDKIRNILNLLFMLLTVAAIIAYFTLEGEKFILFLYICGAAIVVKIMEFIIRFTNR